MPHVQERVRGLTRAVRDLRAAVAVGAGAIIGLAVQHVEVTRTTQEAVGQNAGVGPNDIINMSNAFNGPIQAAMTKVRETHGNATAVSYTISITGKAWPDHGVVADCAR